MSFRTVPATLAEPVAQHIASRTGVQPDTITMIRADNWLQVTGTVPDGPQFRLTTHPHHATLTVIQEAHRPTVADTSLDSPDPISLDWPELIADIATVLLARAELIDPAPVPVSWSAVVHYTADISMHELRLAARGTDDAEYFTASRAVDGGEFTGSVTGEFHRLLAAREQHTATDREVDQRTWLHVDAGGPSTKGSSPWR
jgi:hypothetical protein